MTSSPNNKPFSKRDEKRLLDAMGNALANDFPNPERVGCPGRAVLKAIASRRMGLAEAERWMEHLGSCTPCFREFNAFRKQAERRKRIKVLATAAIVIIAVCVGSWIFVRSRSHRTAEYTAVVLDLRNRLVLRGVPETGEQAQQPLMLLRGVDNVSLYLPSGSRTGTYDVGVFEELGTPLASAVGTASAEGGLTVLKAKLDLSRLKTGHYLVGIRPPGVDWSYYPSIVK